MLRQLRGRDELSPNSEHKNAQNSEHKLSDLAVLREVRGRGELFRTPNAKVKFIFYNSHDQKGYNSVIVYNSHGQNGHNSVIVYTSPGQIGHNSAIVYNSPGQNGHNSVIGYNSPGQNGHNSVIVYNSLVSYVRKS